MYADDTDSLSCSDCKLEFIEKRWTDLLLNWLNKCVHPKASLYELNPWSMVQVLKKYSQDVCADEIDGGLLSSDVEAFVRFKYPLLRLRYYDTNEVQKKMYLMTSILLFHCCVSSMTGTVDGDICTNLCKTDQEMILKFCEKLMDMEVTCNNIELAVKEAFDSVKQDPRTYRKIGHSQNPSKMISEPSESCDSTPEMPLSSSNSKATDAPSTEVMKQKYNAVKFKSAESESFDPCSTSDIPLSSLNSMATDAESKEKRYATFQSLEFESEEQGALAELTPFLSAGKSPTSSLKQKVTTTFKSIEYESYVPCSSTDRPSHISKALCKSPTGSMKQKFNTTIKTVEYESYIPCPDKSSYNSKGSEDSSTGAEKQALNAKSKAEYESCSSSETLSNTWKSLDKTPKDSLEQRISAKSRAKAKFKSYESNTSRDKSPCNSKAVKTPTECRKKKNPNSKMAKYICQSGARPTTAPVISIMTTGKSTTDQKFNSLKFKSSVTVLPSVVTTDASYSELDYVLDYGSKSDTEVKPSYMANSKANLNVAHYVEILPTVESAGSERRCLSNCACSRCSPNGPYCADPGNSIYDCYADRGTAMDSSSDVYYAQTVRETPKPKKKKKKYCPLTRFLFGKNCILITAVVVLLIMIGLLVFMLWSRIRPIITKRSADNNIEGLSANANQEARIFQLNSYICKQGLCQKVYEPTSEYIYSSLSRCILLCMGPQLWPHPIGYTYYSKKVVVLATNKLEYKLQSVPSEAVHLFLAEAFKLFLGDLAKLERYTLDARRMNISRDCMIKKMYIQMDVETDPDPRIRLDTDESYTIKVETITNQVVIKLLSASFCGIRHALETLSQLLLLDQTTGNLITLSNIIIKDAPSYKYRGLMIDTGRNYIPVPDIMRTIDAMATVKLNTFHWRISDVTSFPLHLPAIPQLFEYGSYSRDLVYSKDDVKAVVRRAGIRGIRILLEVAAPGPVGRAWSWIPEATCPTKNKNFTCNNVLCLRLGIHETVFDILQIVYSEILEMTKVDDVFHLSDSVFSMVNCFYLMEEREGFLDKALERLKLANKGFLPKLPIIWYTTHLTKDLEAKTWDRFGVQLTEWQPNPSDQFLSRFKVIHSSRWDLSCEVKKQRCKKYRTWQDMYSWKSWRNLEVFTIEGGESILWTDLVDSGNLDYHLWPRAAAVAERLWSDIVLNGTVTNHVYVRLDNQRWRMVLKSVQVQPIWPLYCSFSPGVCLEKIKYK